ncbi:MAG TPA: molybdate ABC transporter substrate-binding protein [Oculatellaceae cyanobacterium]|jgi:molybdate transport system substrate-binding protein
MEHRSTQINTDVLTNFCNKANIKNYLQLFTASFLLVFATSCAANNKKSSSINLATQTVNLKISAAISLSNLLKEVKQIYKSKHPSVNITYNFGASGALQQQISQGADVDVFFSAATKQMDALQKSSLVVDGTRQNLLTNQLVLITPKNGLFLTNFKQLTDKKIKRIVIGEPKSVPVGQYSQELLTNLEIWQQIKPKVVFGNNVRQVLTFVETGNADAGIVYTTDAKESNQVKVRATAPGNLHSPIIYPVAVIKGSRNQEAAKSFVQFLTTGQAKTVFKKYGFGVVK